MPGKQVKNMLAKTRDFGEKEDLDEERVAAKIGEREEHAPTLICEDAIQEIEVELMKITEEQHQ